MIWESKFLKEEFKDVDKRVESFEKEEYVYLGKCLGKIFK